MVYWPKGVESSPAASGVQSAAHGPLQALLPLPATSRSNTYNVRREPLVRPSPAGAAAGAYAGAYVLCWELGATAQAASGGDATAARSCLMSNPFHQARLILH